MSLFLIVALPFLGALLPGLMNSAGRQACAGVTFMVTLVALVGLLTHLHAVLAGELVTARVDWIPQLGLNLTLMLDSLGFFFALLPAPEVEAPHQTRSWCMPGGRCLFVCLFVCLTSPLKPLIPPR